MKEWTGMVEPWQERAKSASWSLLRWRAARRETEVPALVVEVMLVILQKFLKGHISEFFLKGWKVYRSHIKVTTSQIQMLVIWTQ